MTMPSLSQQVEFARNPEDRCPCVLLLDTSRSMRENDRIGELNRHLRQIGYQLQQDDLTALRAEVCLIEFNNRAKVIQDFMPPQQMQPPTLKASGGTAALAAINLGLDTISKRKESYRSNGIGYYRPMMFLLTDGEIISANDRADRRVLEVRQRLKTEECRRGVAFFGIGIGKDADLEAIDAIATKPAKRLDETKFTEYFRWLSNSIQRITHSRTEDRIILDSTTGWEAI